MPPEDYWQRQESVLTHEAGETMGAGGVTRTQDVGSPLGSRNGGWDTVGSAVAGKTLCLLGVPHRAELEREEYLPSLLLPSTSLLPVPLTG